LERPRPVHHCLDLTRKKYAVVFEEFTAFAQTTRPSQPETNVLEKTPSFKDVSIEISAHFGIESVENLVAIRRNRFINRYGETDNYLCQTLRRLVRLSG